MTVGLDRRHSYHSSIAGSLSHGDGDMIMRTLSRGASRHTDHLSTEMEEDEEERVGFSSKASDWHKYPEVVRIREQSEQDNAHPKLLGVTWKNLTVRGVDHESSICENVLSQFNFPQLIREKRQPNTLKTIIDDCSGCVKPGEMLLVLGRPGSGCTSLLKMLANHRNGYASVEGDINYGSMSAKEAAAYRGEIVINTEEELFYPTLTVEQTIDFACYLKIPKERPSNEPHAKTYAENMKDFLLESVNIPHTKTTKVGNEYVRGVSGGERKRVSIVECLATRATVCCWDNSTRGLDASTALEFTKALRVLTDGLGLTTIVTLYQAGNYIYDLFDKVLVLDAGKTIYYGPMKDARPFMEEQGFVCDNSANIADFLTGVTVPTERQIQPGFEQRFPRNADELHERYMAWPKKSEMMAELDYPSRQGTQKNTEVFKLAVKDQKSKSLPKNSTMTVSFRDQVRSCVKRQYQIIFGDKATFIIKQASTLIQALIAGSLFYNASETSGGLFIRAGAIFFSLMYNSLLSMSEVTESFVGRPILLKHKSFAFYHPGAFCIAQIAADIPVILFQITIFGIVIYFMVGLKMTAGAFFTYWVLIFTTTMCMTAFFRAIGAAFSTFDAASKISGFMISCLIMYTGYMIQRSHMHGWFVWIYYLDPLAYSFAAVLASQFHDKIIPCVGTNLVPRGPSYADTTYHSCTGVGGSIPGKAYVTGDDYLSYLSYSYSHIWRNFGIIWAFWAFFVFITVYFTTKWKALNESSSGILVPRELLGKVRKQNPALVTDEENQTAEKPGPQSSKSSDIEKQLIRNTSVFTWKNLTYTVKTPGGDRVLLDNVHGWVKPGMLGALMGSSGAGKTTLLDVLARRKTDGTIHGSVLVDGRPLSIAFQRSAGYCEQLDVHESMTTVREALEFSAILRQSRETPREEKLAYVDTIVDLLEMHDIENTLVGTIGNGLTVEQRKRLTIGVELVSKPSILIFLDEPTSGLDGQAAYNIVRFLRKLANVGQAVLVTIHQPSASLFEQFDTLLLLAKGGKTVYFGEIGEKACKIKEYFGRYGAPCPDAANPAEHMIDVVSGSLSQNRDWNQVWLDSPESKEMMVELDRIIEDAASKEPGTKDDGHEFATSLREQTAVVLKRMNTSLYRNTDYVNNKFALHVGSALFNGFSFWKIADSVGSLQLRLFTIFHFIFVAPGVINQLQPLFIQRRDIYETREKKSKMYSWKAFVTALIVSEIPYLLICGVLYFACWYYTVGFPTDSNKSGAVLLVMLLYEFIYTGIGQFIAAYAPNPVFASLVNPLVIGILVSFCGVLVPYQQIQAFWRYWMYYLNPFNYLMGSMLTITLFDTPVKCKESEFAIFDTPNGETCQEYLATYLQTYGSRTNLVNPDATSGCRVCEYTRGSDYLATINLLDYYYGWRDIGIVAIFVISSYALVYLLMKLRTKQTKTAE